MVAVRGSVHEINSLKYYEIAGGGTLKGHASHRMYAILRD